MPCPTPGASCRQTWCKPPLSNPRYHSPGNACYTAFVPCQSQAACPPSSTPCATPTSNHSLARPPSSSAAPCACHPPLRPCPGAHLQVHDQGVPQLQPAPHSHAAEAVLLAVLPQQVVGGSGVRVEVARVPGGRQGGPQGRSRKPVSSRGTVPGTPLVSFTCVTFAVPKAPLPDPLLTGW